MHFKKMLQTKPEASAFLMLIAMTFVFSLLSPTFLTLGNFQIVLQPIPEIALVAIGVTILMISGEFDLSVGSVFALSPMVMVLLMAAGFPLPVSMIGGLVVAALVGLANAFITIRLGIPSFIATLGMLFMARSMTVVISDGFPPPFPRDLDLWWIVGKVDLLRVSIFWLLGIGILLGIWLRKFDFGSWIFATGGSQESARNMGINVNLVKTTTFMLCSILAGYELTASAATVMGGAALAGGVGSVIGAVIGALLLAFIENIIILTRVDANWFRFAVGAIIVIAVTINKMTRDVAARAKYKEVEDD